MRELIYPEQAYKCPNCKGSRIGLDRFLQTKKCPFCHGKGWVTVKVVKTFDFGISKDYSWLWEYLCNQDGNEQYYGAPEEAEDG